MLFLFNYKPYIAIIGDIKGSRQLSCRHAVQKQFQQVLDDTNQTYVKDVASSFIITLGD